MAWRKSCGTAFVCLLVSDFLTAEADRFHQNTLEDTAPPWGRLGTLGDQLNNAKKQVGDHLAEAKRQVAASEDAEFTDELKTLVSDGQAKAKNVVDTFKEAKAKFSAFGKRIQDLAKQGEKDGGDLVGQVGKAMTDNKVLAEKAGATLHKQVKREAARLHEQAETGLSSVKAKGQALAKELAEKVAKTVADKRGAAVEQAKKEAQEYAEQVGQNLAKELRHAGASAEKAVQSKLQDLQKKYK